MNAPRYARDDRDPQQTQAAAARDLQRRFGALAWFGAYTGLWWAMVDGRRLVEAADTQQLGEAIMSARRIR